MPRKRATMPQDQSTVLDPVRLLCRAYGLPEPILEHRFHAVRKWRFDYAWPDRKVALEQEGGVWIAGRHTRGAGVIGDFEKYNTATVDGWRILRATPRQIRDGAIGPILQAVLQAAVGCEVQG